jgi:hypothetical protein
MLLATCGDGDDTVQAAGDRATVSLMVVNSQTKTFNESLTTVPIQT